jgi:hypothetical protein
MCFHLHNIVFGNHAILKIQKLMVHAQVDGSMQSWVERHAIGQFCGFFLPSHLHNLLILSHVVFRIFKEGREHGKRS